MAGNFEAAKKLLKAGVSELRKDQRGWTALHHAALRSDAKMLEILMPHDKVTNFGWTAFELQQRLTPHQSFQSFWYKEGSDSPPSKAPPWRFKELTGTTLVDTTFVTSAFLAARWHTPKEQDDKDDDLFAILCKSFEKLHITDDKVYLSKTKQVGFGTFARVAIRAGEVFMRYCGVASTRSGGSYILEDVDAEQFGSLASRVNHSYPNALLHYIQRGEIEEPVLIASEDISPDDEIFINYGGSYSEVIGGDPLELNYDKLVTFVQTHFSTEKATATFMHEMHRLQSLPQPSSESLIKMVRLQNSLGYLLSNPQNLKRLIQEKILSSSIYARFLMGFGDFSEK